MNRIFYSVSLVGCLLVKPLMGYVLAEDLTFGAESEVQGLLAKTDRQETDGAPPVEELTLDVAGESLDAYVKIQSYLTETISYKALFRQINPDGNVVEGTLYMERPGRVRFDYDNEIPFLVVADGKILNFVDYEIGQVTRWPVADTPLGVLLGGGGDLAALGASVDPGPAGLADHVALRAGDPERPELGTVTIFFKELSETDLLELVSWVVEDAQGRITVVEVSDTETNIELNNSLWTFKDPRGLSKRRGRR